MKPPPENTPQNFSSRWVNDHGQFGQPVSLDREIFKKRIKKGFFVEAGASDGEDISNTLYFELRHNWTGILVEGDPQGFSKMKTKVQYYFYLKYFRSIFREIYFSLVHFFEMDFLVM